MKLHKPSARVTHTAPVLVLLMVFETMLVAGTIALVILVVSVVAHANAVMHTVAPAHATVHLLTTVAVILVLVVYNDKMSSHNRHRFEDSISWTV